MSSNLITTTNTNGVEIFKNATDASGVLTVKNAQGYIKMNSFNINAYNTSNDSGSLLLLNTVSGQGVYCLNLGIGAIAGSNRLNVAGGGNSNFGGDCILNGNNNTFQNNILISSRGRIYQQSNANFSLNHISTVEQNFCIQSNRSIDPTASDIFINLNNVAGITLKKTTVFNETVNTIGKLTSEGEFEVDVNVSGTPEFSVANDIIYMYGTKFQITNSTAVGDVERIYMRNNDLDGEIYLQIQSKDVLKVDDFGIDIIGDISYTGSIGPSSDKRLKENIKEIETKKAVNLIKYIVPKTYKYIDKEKYGDKNHCGFIANDFISDKMPDEWNNIVREGRDGYLRFDYSMTTPILWSALQHALNEIDTMKDLFKSMKKEITTMKGEITKLKGKGKGDGKD